MVWWVWVGQVWGRAGAGSGTPRRLKLEVKAGDVAEMTWDVHSTGECECGARSPSVQEGATSAKTHLSLIQIWASGLGQGHLAGLSLAWAVRGKCGVLFPRWALHQGISVSLLYKRGQRYLAGVRVGGPSTHMAEDGTVGGWPGVWVSHLTLGSSRPVKVSGGGGGEP